MGQHQRLAWHNVCPTSHEVQVCALQQAQHATLRAIIHNNPTSPASESAWQALVLSSWLLLDDLQSTPLRATVHTSWMLDWSFFGLRIGLLFGPLCVPNVMLLRCRMHDTQNSHAAKAVTCSQSRYISAYW